MVEKLTAIDIEKLASLSKRRGFVFQSSEIYGGLASTWDYGPLGVEMKKNIKEAWWRTFIWGRDDMVGLDASILMNPNVWRASGHLDSFTDPLVECKNCQRRFRADHLHMSSFSFAIDPDPDYLTVEDSNAQSARSHLRSIASEKAESKGTSIKDFIYHGTAETTMTSATGLKSYPCPHCGAVELIDPRHFNLMFKTFIGPIEEDSAVAYLRPAPK